MYEAGLSVLAFGGLLYVVVWPVLYYLWDCKGLRKYQGLTPLSGVTDLAYCWLSDTGHRSRSTYESHKSKGPILRIGPNALSFGKIAAIKDIYGHGTKCTKDLKETILGGTHTHLFDSIDKAEHARKRKVLSAAFAIKNLEKWEFKVADVVGRIVKVFDQHCTKPPMSTAERLNPDDLTLDYNKYINFFTIEAINKIALSSELGMIERGTDEVTAERLDGSTYRAHYRHSQNQNARAKSTFCWSYGHYKVIAWLSKFVPKYRQIWRDSEPWGDIVYHQAVARLRRYQAGEKLDDFFSSLMDDKDGNPNNLELGEIVAESAAIIDAGAETTSIALTQVMELLVRHPQHMKTLTAELDAVLDEDEVVAPYDKIKDLPFLRACIDEAMRLSPPTSMALPRRTPPEGTYILGEWIPGDTTVGLTIYGAHRDPSVFPDPETFQPHRWMNPQERKRMEPYFIPFSAGARGCIGRNISYLEQTIMLASLVHRYGFAVSRSWQLPRHEAFNLLVGEMPVKIWKRSYCDAGQDESYQLGAEPNELALS